jgi:chromosome segregation ATPase
VQEIEKRAEDLKAALGAAQASERRLTAELEAERGVHAKTRDSVTALTTELVTVKARFEAQAGVADGQAQRLTRVETELTQARESAAAAREEAAKLRGQAEALTAQHAELMQVLKEREGERPNPKGGKK